MHVHWQATQRCKRDHARPGAPPHAPRQQTLQPGLCVHRPLSSQHPTIDQDNPLSRVTRPRRVPPPAPPCQRRRPCEHQAVFTLFAALSLDPVTLIAQVYGHLAGNPLVVDAAPMGCELGYKLPATWLSHGYQSSLSWLSDLIGHALIEDSAFDAARNAAPEELQGLVLVDELDLHLHPSWQRPFIQALRDTFPGLQFIATTHSPLLLSALRPDEVVLLELDANDRIVQRETPRDPRLLTGGELFEEFFGAHSMYAQQLGRQLDDYRFWARNPFRDAQTDEEVQRLRRTLEAQGVALPFEPEPRRPQDDDPTPSTDPER